MGSNYGSEPDVDFLVPFIYNALQSLKMPIPPYMAGHYLMN